MQAEERIRQLDETLVTVQDRTAALQQDHWRDRKELATLQRQSHDIPATLENTQRLEIERVELKQALLRVLSATKALGKDLRS